MCSFTTSTSTDFSTPFSAWMSAETSTSYSTAILTAVSSSTATTAKTSTISNTFFNCEISAVSTLNFSFLVYLIPLFSTPCNTVYVMKRSTRCHVTAFHLKSITAQMPKQNPHHLSVLIKMSEILWALFTSTPLRFCLSSSLERLKISFLQWKNIKSTYSITSNTKHTKDYDRIQSTGMTQYCLSITWLILNVFKCL